MTRRQRRFRRDVPVVREDPARQGGIDKQLAHGGGHAVGSKLRRDHSTGVTRAVTCGAFCALNAAGRINTAIRNRFTARIVHTIVR